VKCVHKDFIADNSLGNWKRFKVYYLENLPKNTWENAPLPIRDLNEEMERNSQIVGLGYIISWPNLIRKCNFVKEHVCEVTCFHPPKAKGERFEEYPEMENGACLAELLIGGYEASFWWNSETIDEYLSMFTDALDKEKRLEHKKLPW